MNTAPSAEEDNIIRILYPKNSQLEIMKCLPNRSFVLVRDRAIVLGVRRMVDRSDRRKINPYHATVTYADLQAAMQYANEGKDKAYVCSIVNSLAENTCKRETSAYWPIPIDIVGFSEVVNNYFDKPRPIPPINLDRIQATTRDLAALLGISLPKQTSH